jgi:hypothetical protein
LLPGVCVRGCWNGDTCPAGTYCHSGDAVCYVQARPDAGG